MSGVEGADRDQGEAGPGDAAVFEQARSSSAERHGRVGVLAVVDVDGTALQHH
jgi:hypothetical protein